MNALKDALKQNSKIKDMAPTKKPSEPKIVSEKIMTFTSTFYDNGSHGVNIDYGEFNRLEILGAIAYMQIQREVSTVQSMSK